MKKNYLIGIGGTGSRVIEAAIFMCAAGFGPDNLTIFIIDPDAGNGNLDRTKNLLQHYMDCRKEIKALSHPVDGNIFRTEIRSPEKPVWGIFDEEMMRDPNTTKLKSIIRYETMKGNERDLSELVDLLFSPEELDMQLTEGFRGHPSIGALVMTQAMDESERPNVESETAWKSFFADLKNPTYQANDIGVFLIGSIFGGTGAAGVPTFAHPNMLKRNKDAVIGELSKVALGGALVLPYFTYKADKAKQGQENVYAKWEEFPLATKGALEFYSEKELGFDQIYFIGDDSEYEVGAFSTGKQDQRNSPHYIEMVTAAAAFDFFDQKLTNDKPTPKGYYIAGRASEDVTWASFPVTRNREGRDKSGELKLKLITMSVMAYVYSTYGMFVLKNRKSTEASSAFWYNKLFPHSLFNRTEGTEKDPRMEDNQGVLTQIDEFLKKYLLWLSKISDLHRDKIKLLKTESIFKDETTLYPYQSNVEKIGNLVKERTENLKMEAFIAQFMNDNAPSVGQNTAVEKFVEIFWKASDTFCRKNYSVTGK